MNNCDLHIHGSMCGCLLELNRAITIDLEKLENICHSHLYALEIAKVFFKQHSYFKFDHLCDQKLNKLAAMWKKKLSIVQDELLERSLLPQSELI